MSKCPCVQFEAEDDEFPDQCACGHTVEEHAPTMEYPGASSCCADETEDP